MSIALHQGFFYKIWRKRQLEGKRCRLAVLQWVQILTRRQHLINVCFLTLLLLLSQAENATPKYCILVCVVACEETWDGLTLLLLLMLALHACCHVERLMFDVKMFHDACSPSKTACKIYYNKLCIRYCMAHEKFGVSIKAISKSK